MAGKDIYEIVEQVLEDAVYWIEYVLVDTCEYLSLRDLPLGDAMDRYSRIPPEATEDWADEGS